MRLNKSCRTCFSLCMVPHLTMPSKTIPAEPTIMPATDIAYGRAKLPDPMLALAKLKNVAITLSTGRERYSTHSCGRVLPRS